MAEGKKVGIILALTGLFGGVIYLTTRAKAAPPPPPPEGYPCPYCPAIFDTYEELAAHVQSEHPGERIPLPIEWE